MKRVTNLNAALKLELNAVSIFSDQYTMFDLTWIASDELITLGNTGTETEKLSSNFGNHSGHFICMYVYVYVITVQVYLLKTVFNHVCMYV